MSASTREHTRIRIYLFHSRMCVSVCERACVHHKRFPHKYDGLCGVQFICIKKQTRTHPARTERHISQHVARNAGLVSMCAPLRSLCVGFECTTTTTSGGGSSCERDHREHSRRWCSASADGPTVDQSTTTTVGIVGPQMLIRIKMVFPARPRQIYSTVWLAVVPSRPRQRVVVLSGHDHHKHRQLVGVLTYF